MSLAALLASPFYTGSGTTIEVPSRYPVALNGVGYFIDTEIGIKRSTIPYLRSQADTGNVPGLQSINPEDLWRRDQESWHHGAGQSYLDRQESDPARFRSSKGIDVWTKWALGLLNDTASKRSSTNTNLRLAVAGTRLYATDGTALLYTTDLTTWTAVTGTPAAAATSITSDGFKIYTANVANGIYRTDTGTGAATQLVTTAVSANAVVGYVKGRLMVGSDRILANVTDLVGPAAMTTLWTHPNLGWKWVDFAEGQTVLYAAGYAGDKSLIYKTSVTPDGTALAIPTVAGELPDGEIVRSIQGYLGYVLIGTDKGVRFAVASADGNLTIGSLTPTTQPVYCFEGQDRFVWFGWSNYDATSTGLGRMDLSAFTSTLTPAYATDLMATAQGAVTSVATFPTTRVFAVSGVGFFAEITNKVASGTIDSGDLTFGIPDEKIAMFIDVRHLDLIGHGSHEALLSVESGAFASLGTHDGVSSESPFNCQQSRGERFEIRNVLYRSGTTATLGPTLTRMTLRAYPSVQRGETVIVPLIIAERFTPSEGAGVDVYMDDPDSVVQGLFDLAEVPQLITYQERGRSATVFVKDVQFDPTTPTENRRSWNGTATVKLVTVKG